ncbi:cytochrome C biogenesis protein [bacterium]|nr:cytochrome C biogenesis protein [bacterium]
MLPLYPGFLVYMSNQLSKQESDRKKIAFLGIMVSAGVIFFMALFGLIFTTILSTSLTNAISIISPIAFSILAFISLFLIFDVDVGRFMPRIKTPIQKNPLKGAFAYGFFFGAIVLPCNPLFIAALFARTLSGLSFIENMIRFISFGTGMALPLMLISLISAAKSKKIIGFLVQNKRRVNMISGLIMLAISIYYLVFVFKIFSIPGV